MQTDDLINFYQTLTPNTLHRFDDFYSQDAFFKDPFNEVRGVGAIKRIFSKMFRTLHEPRFVVTDTIRDEQQMVLVWQFSFRLRRCGKPQSMIVNGVSHLRCNAEGKVCSHCDYWDAASELYMQLPVVGNFFRGMQRMLAA